MDRVIPLEGDPVALRQAITEVEVDTERDVHALAFLGEWVRTRILDPVGERLDALGLSNGLVEDPGR